MKFMMHMNVPGGPYQMAGWSNDDIKRMTAFMHQFNAAFLDPLRAPQYADAINPRDMRELCTPPSGQKQNSLGIVLPLAYRNGLFEPLDHFQACGEMLACSHRMSSAHAFRLRGIQLHITLPTASPV